MMCALESLVARGGMDGEDLVGRLLATFGEASHYGCLQATDGLLAEVMPVRLGLGRIVALYCRASSLYQLH